MTSATTRAAIDNGSVVIRRGDATIWAGKIAALTGFGRAKVPGLQIAWNAPPHEAVFGLGERYDTIDQAGKRVDLWIADAPGQIQKAISPSYFVTPVMYSSSGYAVFAADRALLCDFSAPITGDLVKRSTRITSRASSNVVNQLNAHWFWADQPTRLYDAPIVCGSDPRGTTASIDLTPPHAAARRRIARPPAGVRAHQPCPRGH